MARLSFKKKKTSAGTLLRKCGRHTHDTKDQIWFPCPQDFFHGRFTALFLTQVNQNLILLRTNHTAIQLLRERNKQWPPRVLFLLGSSCVPTLASLFVFLSRQELSASEVYTTTAPRRSQRPLSWSKVPVLIFCWFTASGGHKKRLILFVRFLAWGNVCYFVTDAIPSLKVTKPISAPTWNNEFCPKHCNIFCEGFLFSFVKRFAFNTSFIHVNFVVSFNLPTVVFILGILVKFDLPFSFPLVHICDCTKTPASRERTQHLSAADKTSAFVAPNDRSSDSTCKKRCPRLVHDWKFFAPSFWIPLENARARRCSVNVVRTWAVRFEGEGPRQENDSKRLLFFRRAAQK